MGKYLNRIAVRRRQPRKCALERLEMRRLLAADIGFERTIPLHYEVIDGNDKPAPVYRSPDSAKITSPAQIVEFDPRTRTETIRPLDAYDASIIDTLNQAAQTEGYAGLAKYLEAIGTPGKQSPAGKKGADLSAEYIFGDDDRDRVSNTNAYPYRAVGKQWQTYGTSLFTCSGAMIGPYHWLTAGHCVHQGNGGSWADDITVSLGQDGQPLGGTRSDDQFYGEADWQYVRTFSGWTGSGDWDWDLAIVTLDRNIGDYVGWLGYGWNSSNSFFNNSSFTTSGYPGDLNNSTLGYGQYTQTGNPRTYGITTDLLRTNTMDVWPGQSGSSVWGGGTTNPLSYGVASHHTTIGGTPAYNAFTRITQTKFDAMQGWRSDDNNVREPTDRPDLVDYDDWFNTTVGSVSATSLTPGQSFSATAYPRNNGTAASGDFTVRFRLSTDDNYDTGDYFVGDASVSSIGPFNWSSATGSLNVPTNIPTGSYRLVYSIDAFGDSTEYLENNNRASFPVWLTVSNDINDQISEAISTNVGATVTASINPGYDVDMFSVTVASGQSIGIDIDRSSGSTLDSYLRLFDANGTLMAANDDGAGPAPEQSGLESYIEYTFANAGTYFIGVSGYGNSSYNPTTGFGDANGSTGGFTLILHDFGIEDSDDQIAEAQSLAIGGTRTDDISNDSDVDMFSIAVDEGRIIGFDVDRTNGSLDSLLRLFDDNGNELDFSDDDAGPAPEVSGLESYIQYTFATAGTYYIGVSGYGNRQYDPVNGDGDSPGSVGGYELVAHDLGLVNRPPTDIALSSQSVRENIPTQGGVLIGDFSATDPNSNDTHVFNLIAGTGDQDNDVFEISNGQLFIRSDVVLDYEVQPSYSIRVEATDNGNLSTQKVFTIAVDNLAEIESVVVNGGANQRSRVDSITVQFDSQVTIDESAFQVNRRGPTGGPVDVTFESNVIGGKTYATLLFSGAHTFAGSLNDGNYDLRILGNQIIDLNSNHLDGNKDGDFGGDHVFGADEADGFYRLFGDHDGNRVVGMLDFARFRSAVGSIAGDDNYLGYFDLDNNDSIDRDDFTQFRRRFGTRLDFE
jgi:V8-like Glu-specific endopeptidase